jgi:hypothetical protein
MGVIGDAREALKGVLWMLAGRSDFHSQFDVTAPGVARSFLAAILAIPFTAFGAGVHNALARANEGAIDVVLEPYSLLFVVAQWFASWAYFPLLAAVITAILAKRGGFAPWVVVHNWTHLFVVMVYAVPQALLVSGAAPLAALLLPAVVLFNVYAYVHAAKAALDASWALGAVTGAANLAAMLLVDAGLSEVL